jgi:hypothetical protein
MVCKQKLAHAQTCLYVRSVYQLIAYSTIGKTGALVNHIAQDYENAIELPNRLTMSAASHAKAI